jgi:hypothetical protein
MARNPAANPADGRTIRVSDEVAAVIENKREQLMLERIGHVSRGEALEALLRERDFFKSEVDYLATGEE